MWLSASFPLLGRLIRYDASALFGEDLWMGGVRRAALHLRAEGLALSWETFGCLSFGCVRFKTDTSDRIFTQYLVLGDFLGQEGISARCSYPENDSESSFCTYGQVWSHVSPFRFQTLQPTTLETSFSPLSLSSKLNWWPIDDEIGEREEMPCLIHKEFHKDKKDAS